ncbi:MAG: redoxin domain-containing protein [Rhodocyclaceae bacterium]|nr:redoxin domain-containing protein [Rhodocyclaceae bacterium]
MTSPRLAALILGALCIRSAAAALPVGATAPDFRAPAAFDGQRLDYDLVATRSEGPVVVYFYPSAYTSGCNVQARTFSRDHDKFAAAGARVVGVSLDSIERLQAFSADPDFCAGRFPVVSDADGRIAKAFDLRVSAGGGGYRDTRGEAIEHGFAERTTFVVAPDGRIVAAISGLGPEQNVAAALKAVQAMTRTAP